MDVPAKNIGGTGIIKPDIKLPATSRPPVTKNGIKQYLTMAADVIMILWYFGLQQRAHTIIFNIPEIKGDKNIKVRSIPFWLVKIFESARYEDKTYKIGNM